MPQNRISTDKNGRYHYSATDKAGKRYQLASQKSETLRAFKLRCDELDAQCAFDIADLRLTFDDLFNRWASAKWSHTQSDYESGMNTGAADYFSTHELYTRHLKDKIGHLKLIEIQRSVLYELLIKLRNNGLADSTISKIKGCISRPYNWALNVLRLNIPDPITGLRLERRKTSAKEDELDKTNVRFFNSEDEKRFFDAAVNSKYINYFRLLLLTGMRPSEALGLRKSDVDLINKKINLTRGITIYGVGELKSKSAYRQIPITDEVMKILDAQRKISLNSWLFPSSSGTPSFNAVRKAFQNVIRQTAEWEKLGRKYHGTLITEALEHSLYDFRHTFGTRMAERGMPDHVLMYLMGHSDISITKRYYIGITDTMLTDAILYMSGELPPSNVAARHMIL